MPFLEANISRSWDDTFQLFGGGKKVMMWGLVFLIAWIVKYMFREKAKAAEHIKDAFWGVVITVLCFTVVFFFHLFWLSPIRIYAGQAQAITDLRDATNLFQQQLSNKADAEWKSSSIYQRQLTVKADLINTGAWFSKMADKIEKNKTELPQDSMDAMNFVMGRADDVLRESRNENLPVEKLAGIIYGTINRPFSSNKDIAYRDAAIECTNLAGQLPKKLWP